MGGSVAILACSRAGHYDILVSMTRTKKTPPPGRAKASARAGGRPAIGCCRTPRRASANSCAASAARGRSM